METSEVLLFAAGWILVNPKPVSSYLGIVRRESISSVHIWSAVQQSSCTAVHKACTHAQPSYIFTPAMLMEAWSLWICPFNYVQLMHKFKNMWSSIEWRNLKWSHKEYQGFDISCNTHELLLDCTGTDIPLREVVANIENGLPLVHSCIGKNATDQWQ